MGTLALQGKENAAFANQWQAPACKLLQAGYGPRSHDIEFFVHLIGTPPNDSHIGEAEFIGDLFQVCRTPQQWLNQGDLEIRSGYRPHQSRKARPRANVGYRGALGNPGHNHGRVENMPVPQPRNLPRTDQATHHAISRKRLDVPLGEWKAR